MRCRCASRRCAIDGIRTMRCRDGSQRSVACRWTPDRVLAAAAVAHAGRQAIAAYFSLLQVAMVVAPRTTDHLFSSTLTSVKQVGLLPFQLVQNPSLLSFQVPSPFTPAARLIGSRVILPSGRNTILNLMLEGVEDVNGWPSKNVS